MYEVLLMFEYMAVKTNPSNDCIIASQPARISGQNFEGSDCTEKLIETLKISPFSSIFLYTDFLKY